MSSQVIPIRRPERTVVAPPPRPIPLPVEVPAASNALARRLYLRLLTWAFTLLNTVRVLSYVPTMWAIHVSGDSSQHSLVTWATWFGANLTMSAWLYENNGGKCDRAIAINLANSAMCLATMALIAWYRV